MLSASTSTWQGKGMDITKPQKTKKGKGTSKLQSLAGTMPFEQSFFAWKVLGRHIVNVIKNCKRMLDSIKTQDWCSK